tara:strand:- start:9480 stop:10160 length:681 start_codon:yes stop_codon:yes gene_type:complete
MSEGKTNRRKFLAWSAALVGGGILAYNWEKATDLILSAKENYDDIGRNKALKRKTFEENLIRAQENPRDAWFKIMSERGLTEPFLYDVNINGVGNSEHVSIVRPDLVGGSAEDHGVSDVASLWPEAISDRYKLVTTDGDSNNSIYHLLGQTISAPFMFGWNSDTRRIDAIAKVIAGGGKPYQHLVYEHKGGDEFFYNEPKVVEESADPRSLEVFDSLDTTLSYLGE